MKAIVDVGSGDPLLLIPGIQGRWEWMRPTVEALAKHWRVISFSLPGEPGADPDSKLDFESFVHSIDRVLDACGVRSTVICGVSFGGLIAIRYAAQRPNRVRALILVSTPGPRWKPQQRIARYMRWPRLSSPLFLLRSVSRFWPELRMTYPALGSRLSFCTATIARLLAAPAAPSRMGRRARLAAAETFEEDCARVAVPTLVVSGERDLDRVVMHDDTLAYVRLIDGACFELFDNTGHLGIISAPERFAAIVSRFKTRAGL